MLVWSHWKKYFIALYTSDIFCCNTEMVIIAILLQQKCLFIWVLLLQENSDNSIDIEKVDCQLSNCCNYTNDTVAWPVMLFFCRSADMERRDLSHKEKLYLREQNVITETQCTLGRNHSLDTIVRIILLHWTKSSASHCICSLVLCLCFFFFFIFVKSSVVVE